MIESIKNLLKDLCSYVAIAAAVTLFSVDRATTEVINYFIFQVFICIIGNYTNLRLVSAVFYQIFVFSSTDSPSKTMKNVFYFV